jgi:protein CpxP
MSARNLLIAASVIASGFAGGLALAQPASQPPSQQTGAPTTQVQRADHVRSAPGQFIEGRIAFLKTELKLTAQQTPLFDKLADEMRTGAKAMQERHAQRQQASAQGNVQAPAPQSALETLERRSTAMKEMTTVQDRYLAAFRPLYQSLSDDQKKTADLLFAKGGHPGGKHRMHKSH